MTRAVAVLLVVAASACGSSAPRYDRDTPEGTVRALFKAINAGRMPADVSKFFVDEFEVTTWRMRCQSHGCAAAEIESLEVTESSRYRAELRITYVVRSDVGGAIMRGADSPVVLHREGKRWYIAQFGDRATPPAPPPADAGPPTPRPSPP